MSSKTNKKGTSKLPTAPQLVQTELRPVNEALRLMGQQQVLPALGRNQFVRLRPVEEAQALHQSQCHRQRHTKTGRIIRASLSPNQEQ